MSNEILTNEKSYAKEELKSGTIWGIVTASIVLALSIAGAILIEDVFALVGGAIIAYALGSMVACILWETWIQDLFEFFLKSFTMPGVIFELSISGILSLIFIKILFSILATLLSVVCFIVGVIITSFLSMFAFPFLLVLKIKSTK